jgi:AraC-like DNA-binding protein
MRGAQAVLASSRRALSRHSHEQFGIGVIERGGQRSHSGRGQVEAGPGDVITVNPGEVHDGVPLGRSGRAWRILYLDPTIVSLASWDVQEAKEGQVELSRPVLRDRRAAHLARGLFQAVTLQTCALRQEELLLATLAAIGGTPKVGKRQAMTPEVARARSLIDADPVAPVTLADLALTSGIGRFQLLRSFARATGLTPHAYILQRRLELARRLIAQGAALADCAAASGFADQSHMTRAFASRYGLTPGAFAAVSR